VGLGVALTVIVTTSGGGGGGGAPAQDPTDVHSTSHEIGVWSSENVIAIAWSEQEGTSAYSLTWSGGPDDLPDTISDLPGDATGTASEPLAGGVWYFHLRTQGEDGGWTSTVHLGPFFILSSEEDEEEGPTPTGEDGAPEETPTLSPTLSPTATGGGGSTPAPTPTVKPTPTPTPTPTPEPPLKVAIDIRPGVFPNVIKLYGDGPVPVAVLSGGGFDAQNVDVETVRFEGAAPLSWTFADVDGDKIEDLVLYFNVGDTGIGPNDTEACLTGEALKGQPFQGCDSIIVIDQGYEY
jgi:hypothetical protein